jgi:hypothetical protein
MAGECIAKCVMLKDNMGEMELRLRPAYEGFFYSKNLGVQPNRFKLQALPTPGSLYHSLGILEDYVEEFNDFKKNFGYVLHWISYAPFSFAKKQLGENGFQPGLILFGDSQAGKSTTAKTLCHIWSLRQIDHALSGSDVDTPYNLAQESQQDTWPRIIDEGEALYDNQNKELNNMIKNMPQKIHSRTRQNTNGIRESSVALSNLLITSNVNRPSEGALSVRIRTLEYFGKPKSRDEVELFMDKYQPDSERGVLAQLGELGYAFAYLMCNDDSLLHCKWEEAAMRMWTEVYSMAQRPMPDWLAEPGETDDIYSTLDDQHAIQEGAIIATLMKSWQGALAMNQSTLKETSEKFLHIADLGIETWLKVNEVKRGPYAGTYYIINKDFERALVKHTGLSMNLEMISQVIGGKYNRITRLGKKRLPAITFTKEELEELLDGQSSVNKNPFKFKKP